MIVRASHYSECMSTNRSHLIPTLITDKNGAAAIRWTKPVAATSSKATLPAVTAQQVTTQQLINNAASLLTQAVVARYENPEDNAGQLSDNCRAALSTFSRETLQRINDTEMSEYRTMHLAEEIIDGWSESTVNDYLHLIDLFDAEQFYQKECKLFLDGITHYEGMAHETYGHYPAERASQINALVAVTRHMMNNDIDCYESFNPDDEWDEVPIVKDAALRSLIIGSDHNRESIVRVIKERNVYDAETIKHLLDNGVLTPLGDGVL